MLFFYKKKNGKKISANLYVKTYGKIRENWVPSNGVIRTTLHFQFYFELKETFEKIKLPQLLATNCGIIKKIFAPESDLHYLN